MVGDELIGGRAVGVRLTLASPTLVRWGAKATGGEAGGQGAAGDKGPTTPPPAPLVINGSATQTSRARQLTPESPLLFGVVTFPTPLIDERPPPPPPRPLFTPTTNYGNIAKRGARSTRPAAARPPLPDPTEDVEAERKRQFEVALGRTPLVPSDPPPLPSLPHLPPPHQWHLLKLLRKTSHFPFSYR